MNVNYCLRRARQLDGNKTAILDDDRALTYAQFHNQVEETARRLWALGIRSGDRVAVLMANSPAYLELYYSLPLLGAWIVPYERPLAPERIGLHADRFGLLLPVGR